MSLCVSRKFLARVCSFWISIVKFEGNQPHCRSLSLSPSYQPANKKMCQFIFQRMCLRGSKNIKWQKLCVWGGGGGPQVTSYMTWGKPGNKLIKGVNPPPPTLTVRTSSSKPSGKTQYLLPKSKGMCVWGFKMFSYRRPFSYRLLRHPLSVDPVHRAVGPCSQTQPAPGDNLEREGRRKRDDDDGLPPPELITINQSYPTSGKSSHPPSRHLVG